MEVSINITDRNGTRHEVKAPTDMALNLMQVIRAYELAPPGTVGICEGMAMCPTCQCYVLNDIALPEKREMEEATLSKLLHTKASSRLSCQIPITKDLEGLEIELAPFL